MGKFIPNVEFAHCFDHTKVAPFSTPYLDRSHEGITKLSLAVQMGLGSHYYLNDRFNWSFSAQYMKQLGAHFEAELLETELLETE